MDKKENQAFKNICDNSIFPKEVSNDCGPKSYKKLKYRNHKSVITIPLIATSRKLVLVLE